MTIKYNNKVIAGKYREQVIPFANTVDAGISKIATQEQINEGTDNTSIVTPVYLAQKQDKLTAGEGIDIDATNTISSKVLPDKVTIVENDNKTLSTVARKTINEKLVFDWEGTEAEYHQAIMNGEIDPDWYCYITDDELSVSYNDVLSRTLVNIAPDGVKVLGASNAYLTNDVYIDEAGYNQLLELKNSATQNGVDNITVNETLVAIPYVLTHTGSKITDAKYRDILVDFYNENGYTNYFTIDEENKNYTLPMGEIYGKLVDKDLSDISEIAKDIIKDIAGVSFNLFDTKIADHELSLEESLGWALQGTYVYKEAITGERFGYPTFYERCIEEKNAGKATSVTLGSSTITMYVNDNGHQFYNIADKSVVDTYYASFGIADFYGIDEENECIFLPRNKWFVQLTDSTANVNKFTDAGLPNITGYASTETENSAKFSGVLKQTVDTNGLWNSEPDNAPEKSEYNCIEFDASLSNPIYGKSTTVQPKSSSKLLYYCVGNTKADTSWVNVFAQVEEGIKEIYDQKAEILEEIDTLRETSVNEIDTLKQDSVNEIDTLRATSVNEISTLNTGSLNQIETLTNENISKIENVKNTSLNELNVLKHQGVDELETLRKESVDEIGGLKQEGVNEINTLKEDSIDEMEDKRVSSNESITTTKNESISEFIGIASDKIDEAKYWAVGTEKENPQGSAKYWAGVAELSSSNALFDTKVSDHILKDSEAYGWALQGTYVYEKAILGEHIGYPTFYYKCIEEYTNPTNEKLYLSSNINTVGSLNNNNGILSGFTTANYAKIPNKVNLGNNFEVVFKITTGEDITTNQRIFDGLTEQYLTCFIASNTNCFNYAFGDGTQWLQTSEEMLGKNQINSNTSYKIKITFDGTVYISYISTEDGLWIEDWRWESTNIIPEYNFIIGVSRDFSTPCLCSIDLNESYIDINGERWWEGVSYIHKNLNGHKYYDIKNKNIIDNLYNKYGIADFYGIDEVNERILLPRNKYFYQLTGDTSKVNEMVEAGLPNITGTLISPGKTNEAYDGTLDGNGVFKSNKTGVSFKATTASSTRSIGVDFNASRSSAVYGNSNTVQPQSSLKLLYYCVGNTKADTSWMKLTEQVEAGIKEIEDKRAESIEDVDKLRVDSIQEIDTLRVDSVEEVDTLRLNSVNEVDTLRNQSVEEINTLKTDSVQEIVNTKTNSLEEIDTLRINSVQEITDTKNNGLQEVDTLRKTSVNEIDTLRQNSVDEILDTKQNSLNELEDKRVSCNESITTTKEESIEEINTTTADLIDQARKWAVGESDENTEGSAKFWAETAQLASSNALFDTKVSDHVLEGPDAYGWALQGTYVYKDAVLNEHLGYPTFYDKCIEEKNAGTATSVTLGSNTLTIYKNANGHQYYDIADKSKIDAWYTTYGIADYYGIDEENECIFLPRNKWFQQLTDSISQVNTFKQAGLPNHKHYEFGTTGGAGADGDPPSNKLSATAQVRSSGGGGYGRYLLAQDSKEATVGLSSNPIDQTVYGKSTTVQPQSSLKLLYYCVGNTKADTSWIKLVEQVEEGIKEIYDEKIKSLEEIDTLRQDSVQEVDTLRQDSVQEVVETKNESLIQLDKTTSNGLQSLTGASNAITRNQITNCWTKIPQRIKHTLADGTLTILAGTVAIFPYGTKYPFETFGSLTINEENIASGFSSTNYIVFKEPFNPESNTWEQMWKITTGEDIVSVNNVLNRVPENLSSGFCFVIKDSKIGIYISSGTESYDIANALWSEQTLEPNTTYYIKNSFDGSKYSMDISTDKIDFTNYITVESTLTISPIKNKIGAYGTEEHHFRGSIHLNECYIKIGDEIWWEGKTRNLEEECPIGSTFLNEFYKVADTYWDGSKFFVWAEIQRDYSVVYGSVNTDMMLTAYTLGGYQLTGVEYTTSGTTAPSTSSSRQFWYDITNNYVKNYGSNTTEFSYNSLPLMLVDCIEANKFKVDHTFNGWGYIGSHFWYENLEGLISNGYNDDGTYRNIAIKTRKMVVAQAISGTGARDLLVGANGYAGQNIANRCFYQEEEPNITGSSSNNWYNPKTNKSYQFNGTNWVEIPTLKLFTEHITDTNITSVTDTPKTFRFLDYREFQTNLKEAQVVVETYQNGASWYRIWSDGWCEQGGTVSQALATLVVAFLKEYNSTNYTLSVYKRGADDDTGGYADEHCAVNGKGSYDYGQSTTGFRCSTSNATAKFTWKAEGYIK